MSHPICALHEMGEDHPEQPDRVRRIEDALITNGLMGKLLPVAPFKAEIDDVLRVHHARYVWALEHGQPSCGEYQEITPDTMMNCYTWDAALYASGAGIAAIDKIMAGDIDRAFCNVRPPGHHAEQTRCMGFCFINNVAVAARHALEVYGLHKVAIVDFDVHHGNGTEDIFKDDPRVLLCSTFQFPLYPGTGTNTSSEHIVNVPFPEGTDSAAFRAAFDAKVLPALVGYQPEMIFFSAGFDAHQSDPLASMSLVEEDFYWVTKRVIDATYPFSKGRVVSMLEGGYNLDALAASACQHVKALIDS